MDLLGYIEKYGHLSFEEKGFNHVEAAIFVFLSYAKFERFVPGFETENGAISLCNLTEKNIADLSAARTFGEENGKLIKSMYRTKRYRNVTVQYAMSVSDKEALEQFFALTFDIPGVGLFISFRGTDGTLIGWKENFSVLYQGATLAQIDTIEYLYQVSKHQPNRNFIIGGHSKGGNLSMYGLFFAPKELNEKIQTAYSFDGFGFQTKNFRSVPDYEKDLEKFVQIVPRDSLVGELFYTPLNPTVIEAVGKGMIQHHPFHWIITEDGTFLRVSQRGFFTRLWHRTIKKWSQVASQHNYKVFVEVLTSALEGKNGEFDIYGKGSENKVKKVLCALKPFSPKEKRSFFWMILMLIWKFITSLVYYINASFCHIFSKKRRKNNKQKNRGC